MIGPMPVVTLCMGEKNLTHLKEHTMRDSIWTPRRTERPRRDERPYLEAPAPCWEHIPAPPEEDADASEQTSEPRVIVIDI